MKLKILFLCTGNSCRSQMAEAWGNHLQSSNFNFYSAGTSPKTIDLRAVKVMSEVGIDISKQISKRPEEIKVEFDYVITVCDSAHESCPFFPAKTKILHHRFDDPPRLAQNCKNEEEILQEYRRVRDEIKAFVATIQQTLNIATIGET